MHEASCQLHLAPCWTECKSSLYTTWQVRIKIAQPTNINNSICEKPEPKQSLCNSSCTAQDLTCASLPVRHDAAIVPQQYIINYGANSFIIHILLRRVLGKDAVKHEFALCNVTISAESHEFENGHTEKLELNTIVSLLESICEGRIRSLHADLLEVASNELCCPCCLGICFKRWPDSDKHSYSICEQERLRSISVRATAASQVESATPEQHSLIVHSMAGNKQQTTSIHQ